MSAWAAATIVLAIAAWAAPRLAAARGPSSRCTRTPRHRSPTPEDWAALLDSMSAEIRTGSSLQAALHQAVVRHHPSGQAVNATAIVAAIATARVADPDEAVVVQAIGAAHVLGGPVAATLDAASALLRERAVVRSDALAHSAQARLSARVLTGVPLAFAGWSLLSSAAFRAALFSPIGLTAAVLGAISNLIGWWWMRRIVGRALA